MGRSSKPTIYDIAKIAGVSRQTVSRVLNNRPDVSPDTRKQILDIIHELNYQPSAVARSLSRQKTNLLGVVTAGLQFIGPSRTLSGITKKSQSLGYGLLIKELDSFTANHVQPLLDWFQAHQVDGILWAAPEISDNRSWVDQLNPELDIPIIFLTMDKRDNLCIVNIDNIEGAKMATQHLYDQGCENVGHISGPLDWWEACQRKKGWEFVHQNVGNKLSDRMWIEGNWSSRSGKSAFLNLIEMFPQLDGIFVGNDQMALGAIQAMIQLGKRIPDDIKVVGFDGIPEAEFFYPSLTTVSQNQQELGSLAVEKLIYYIEHKETSDLSVPKYIQIQPELIIRDSSNCS